MPSLPPPASRPRSRRRFLVLALGISLAIIVIGLLTLPSLIRTEFARTRILAAINARLAPGRLEVQRFDVSWTGPIRLVGFHLVAPDGIPVATAPVAVLDRSLGALVLRPSAPTVLLLDRASLVLHRHLDGRLDLAEALQGVIAHPDPTRDLTVRVTHGSLSLQAEPLLEPIQAETADLEIKIPPAPRAMTWHLKLQHADGGSIVTQGDINRWTAPEQDPDRANLHLEMKADRWPIAARTNQLDANGILDGSIALDRGGERWQSSGNLRLDSGSVTGEWLRGDTVRPGLVTFVWDGKEGGKGWVIRRLAVDSPLGSVRAEGSLNADLRVAAPGVEPPRIEGRLNLAALAQQLPQTLQLPFRPGLTVTEGTARFLVETPTASRASIRTEATLSDLVALDGDRRLTLRDPLTLAADVIRSDESVTIKKLSAQTGFGTAELSGRLNDLSLSGSVDLGAFRRQLGDWIDLGTLRGSGQAQILGSYRVIDQQFIARLATEVHDLRLEGLADGPLVPPLPTLDLTINGRPDDSDLPVAWDSILVAVASGDSSGRVELHPADEMIQVAARLIVALNDRHAELTLNGSWAEDRRRLVCDRVVARLVPTDGTAAPNRVELVAKGEIDASAGTIQFDPIAPPESTAVALRLAPEGIRIRGLGADLQAFRVDGGFEGDIIVPNGLTTANDHWSATLNARGDDEGFQFSGRGEIESDRGERAGLGRIAGNYRQSEDRVNLVELQAKSAYGTLSGSGRLDDATGSRHFELQGELSPDFEAITAWFDREVETEAKLVGLSRPFRFAGNLGGTVPLQSIEGEVGFDLVSADLYGMKLGATPVVVRAKEGRIFLDPISTTLNEGHLRLESEVGRDAKTGSPVLLLGKNSSIRDARINDEVSRRVLAFVAPVLEGATRASGRISVDLDRAQIPLSVGGSKAAQVDGLVVFDDVVFAPGELANGLLTAVGRRDAVLRLDRPLTLTIADGRVNQSGLGLPIGDFTRIEVAGWVDFDQNLSLTATLPVTRAMLGDNPLLSDIAAGTRIRVPINGTLNSPSIDQEAFGAELKVLGKSLLTRGATRGALEILRRMNRNRARNASPGSPTRP